MKWLKLAAAAVVLAAGIAVLYFDCYVPAICNRTKRAARHATDEASKDVPYDAVIAARKTLDSVALCRKLCVTDPEVSMIVAANQRLTGSIDESIASYQSALSYARRPEIYFNLGITLTERNRRREALDAFTEAGTFAPQYLEEIPDGQLKVQAMHIVGDYENRLRQQR
jgi:tetratricopeptide (TPR) repeat protein